MFLKTQITPVHFTQAFVHNGHPKSYFDLRLKEETKRTKKLSPPKSEKHSPKGKKIKKPPAKIRRGRSRTDDDVMEAS